MRWCLPLGIVLLLAGSGEIQPASSAAQAPERAPAASDRAAPPAGGLLGLPPSNDAGAQKAARLLEQMVQALGGQAYLGMQDMEQTGRTFSFYHGEAEGAGALFWRFWKWPDKERIELTKQRDWVILYNGDNGYEITFRGTAMLEPEALDDYLRRRRHSLAWVLRQWLKEPGVAILYSGVGMAERKQADQVLVITALNDSVTISIDSITHLPLQVAFTWRDPKTRDRWEEAEGYDNYRPVQGIMTPFNVTRYKDGQPVSQRFFTEAKYNQNLPDSMFQASATAAPGKAPQRK